MSIQPYTYEYAGIVHDVKLFAGMKCVRILTTTQIYLTKAVMVMGQKPCPQSVV